MSNKELDKLVLPAIGGDGIKEWIPEQYGFVARDEHRNVFVKGRYELRRMKYNNWLLRKSRKNDKGVTELLVKWGMIVIEPSEIDYADMMFTKGLR